MCNFLTRVSSFRAAIEMKGPNYQPSYVGTNINVPVWSIYKLAVNIKLWDFIRSTQTLVSMALFIFVHFPLNIYLNLLYNWLVW